MRYTSLTAIPDDKLLRRLFEILTKTRHDEADLVAHVAEVDARKLYAREAAPSMFAWCTEVLHLSEQEAYLRITVARASREIPTLLTMLRDGRLHLSGIARLVPHLTRENQRAVLKRAAGMSHRQIKELVSELEPKPDAPAKIRKLPGPSAGTSARDAHQLGAHRVVSPAAGLRAGESLSTGRAGDPARLDDPGTDLGAHRVLELAERPAARAVASSKRASPGPAMMEPLAPARYKVQFTADAELRDKLERLQALMRSSVPDGDLAKIIDVAVTEKLQRLETKRFAKTKAPRKRLAQTDTRAKSRHIPAAVRRFVEERDGGRCTYRDRRGRRCTRRHDLEFHHKEAFGRGGDHRPENLALMCHVHNALLAERDYGKEVMARFRRSGRRDTKAAVVVGAGDRERTLRAQWRRPV